MKKLMLLLMIGIIAIISLNSVLAVDVAYIIRSSYEIKEEFRNALTELNMSYDIINANNVSNTNFSNYKLMLLNDEYFTNWNEIPINNFSALIVNGRNIDKWGWTTRVSVASQSSPIHINLNESYDMAYNLANNIQVYTSAGPDIYYLDDRDVYNGIEIVGSTAYDSKDAVVGIARKGKILTKQGMPSTTINANSAFFGIKDTAYWTNETKELFKNALLWLRINEFNISLKAGYNLISLPLILDTTNINEILSRNPDVIAVKEYNRSIVNATQMLNNKGYFVQASRDTILNIKGAKPRRTQNVSLGKGMNLVGITSLSNISLSSLPAGIIEIAKRNNDRNYQIAWKSGSVWINSFSLEPGKGYWFKTNTGVTWSYNPE